MISQSCKILSLAIGVLKSLHKATTTAGVEYLIASSVVGIFIIIVSLKILSNPIEGQFFNNY